jgi:hypothetical protein
MRLAKSEMVKKLAYVGLAWFISMSAHGQTQNKNQEIGEFLSKCYATGIHVQANDKEATTELKARIRKWTINIAITSKKYITDDELNAGIRSELAVLKQQDRKYLSSMVSICTKALGDW